MTANPGFWSSLALAILGPWSSGDILGHQGATLAANPGSWSPLTLAILGPLVFRRRPRPSGDNLGCRHWPPARLPDQGSLKETSLPVPEPAPALLTSLAPALLQPCSPALLTSLAPALLTSPAPALLQPCSSLAHQPCSPVHLYPEHQDTSVGASGESGEEGPRPAKGGSGSTAPWCHRPAEPESGSGDKRDPAENERQSRGGGADGPRHHHPLCHWSGRISTRELIPVISLQS